MSLKPATQNNLVKSTVVMHQLSESEKKAAAMKAMFENAKQQDDALPQDAIEGVDPDEWD